jgi:quercetin dioxygenase-like cupin family protein
LHVAPADLRTVSQGGLIVRFAMLGSMAYVLAETPAAGSADTSLERPCTDPHWGFVIEGELTVVRGRRRETIGAGRAFHVFAGEPPHHFETTKPALVAGFAPVDPALDVSDRTLAAQGFNVVAQRSPAIIVPAVTQVEIPAGTIRSESWPMSGYVLTQVRMGERSGYGAPWCDAPHWGIVTSGSLAIEFEDDVEVIAAGDVFHCPAGPPGHRAEAADPATFLDLTPLTAFENGGRLSDWRRGVVGVPATPTHGIAVTALV